MVPLRSGSADVHLPPSKHCILAVEIIFSVAILAVAANRTGPLPEGNAQQKGNTAPRWIPLPPRALDAYGGIVQANGSAPVCV